MPEYLKDKLLAQSMAAMHLSAESTELRWARRPNINYKIYFTEDLTREWSVVPPDSYLYKSFSSQATALLPRLTERGFYKIVSEIQDRDMLSHPLILWFHIG
ncbi:MAG: hypothetical protein PHO37_11430 [Kiritimatiellae bacterium]|nr:hypothetical protein [Kiritimatiellia bacterium]